MNKTDDLKQKLSNEIEEADWSMLQQHHQRGAVFLVDLSVDLVEVAVALASDDVEIVKSWQNAEKLRRPAEAEVAHWQSSAHKKMANFIIIQPYVLIQLIAS